MVKKFVPLFCRIAFVVSTSLLPTANVSFSAQRCLCHCLAKRQAALCGWQVNKFVPSAKRRLEKKGFAFFRQAIIFTKGVGAVNGEKIMGKQCSEIFRFNALPAAKNHFGKMIIGLDRLIVKANQKLEKGLTDGRFFHEKCTTEGVIY